jgi:hypothetical protein
MRRSSSTLEPQAIAAGALPVVLQRALANLDIHMEQELTRYRRQRRLEPLSGGTTGTRAARMGAAPGGAGTPGPISQQVIPKRLDLISIPAVATATSTGTGRGVEGQTVERQTVERHAVERQTVESVELAGVDANAVTSTALAVAPSEEDTVALLEVYGTASAPALQQHGLDGHGLDGHGLDDQLDDYLESSEELLRSLAAEEAQVRVEQGLMKSLVTPLGIGTMLLLLLASSGLGYLLMNPTNLQAVVAKVFRAVPPPAPAGESANPTTAEAGLSPLDPNLAAQEFPDVTIHTLGTLKLNGAALKSPALPSPLPTANSKPATAPSPKPPTPTVAGAKTGGPVPLAIGPFGPATVRPAAPPTGPVYTPPQPRHSAAPKTAPHYGSSYGSGYTPPVSSGYTAPAPRSVPRSPTSGGSQRPLPTVPVAPTVSSPVPSSPAAHSPSTGTPSPAASSAPSSAASAPSRHTVVVPFTNDRDLDAAQRVDPNAQLDNGFDDGVARVRAGSFDNEAGAKARVEELQRQGVNAEIREEK